MKLKWIVGLLFSTALALPSSAQIAVYIGHPLPRVRYEHRGPYPGEGYAWVNGYWAPQGGRYQWVAGRWDHPRPIKALAGPVLATSTTSKAGRCMKITGTVTSMVSAAITSVVAA